MNGLNLPREIETALCGRTLRRDTLGRSQAQVFEAEDRFLKIAPRGSLRRAADMQAFLHEAGFGPARLAYCPDGECDYLLTERAKGRDATKWLDRPEWVARQMGLALRRLHALDMAACPVTDGNDRAIALYERETGRQIDASALRRDAVTHGDFCLPNVFLDDSGFTGLIDPGEGGLGDRHFDLYWGCWSLAYNLGTDRLNDCFLDAYGRDAVDDERMNLCARLSRCAE